MQLVSPPRFAGQFAELKSRKLLTRPLELAFTITSVIYEIKTNNANFFFHFFLKFYLHIKK